MRKLLILAFLMVFVAVPFVSAFDFSHYQNPIDSNTVVINGGWTEFWQNIAYVKLAENTNFCGSDCQAILDINLLRDYNAPITGLSFSKEVNGQFVQGYDLPYEVYIKIGETPKEVPKYDFVPNSDGFSYDRIENGTQTIYEDVWREVSLEGLDLQAGNYTIKLVGHKDPSDTYDWVGSFMGVPVDQWAIWSGYQSNLDKTLYYKFNQGSGTTVNDELNAYNGLEIGGNQVWMPSMFGANTFINATNFTGSSLINTTYQGTGGALQNWTLEMRMSPRAVTSSGFLIWGRPGGATNGWGLAFDGAGKLSWVIGGCTQMNSIGLTWTVGSNHTLVVTRNDSTWWLYEDGVPQQNRTCTLATFDTWNLTIGRDPSGYFGGNYVGQIDQVILWNRTLTRAEIVSANNSDSDGTDSVMTVTLNSPVQGYNTTVNTSVLFNATGSYNFAMTKTFTDACVYVYNSTGGSVNRTCNVGLSGTLTNTTTWNVIQNLQDGLYNWTAFFNDTQNGLTWSPVNKTFRIDATPPSLNILTPLNSSIQTNEANVSFNYSSSDSGIGLDLCWYNLDGGANITLSGCINTTFATTSGDHTVNLWSNDSLNNLRFNSSRFTIANTTFIQSFNASSIETKNEAFMTSLNASSGVIVRNVYFTYGSNTNNSVILNSSRNSVQYFNTTARVPFIAPQNNTNVSFYWTFNISYGATTSLVNSSFINQSVFRMMITTCGFNTNATTLNYTTYYESNRSVLPGSFFQSTFFIWLPENYNTASLSENYSTNIASSASGSFPYCIYPTWASYSLDSYDQYGKGGFASRTHIFQNAQVSNGTQNISLYLLDSANSTSVVIKTTDGNLVPISGIVVRLYKFYADLNQFVQVDSGKTDDLGQAIVQAQQYFTPYQIYFYDSNNTLVLQTNTTQIVCYSNPCVINYVLNSGYSNLFKNYLDNGLAYSLSFNNDTGNVTFTYNDANGLTHSIRMVVYQVNATGYYVLYNNTISSNSGTMVYHVPVNGTFFAQAFFSQSPESVLDRISFSVSQFSSQFTLDAMFWTIMFVLTLVMVGIYNPSVAIGMGVLGVVGVWLLGFVAFTWATVITIVVMGGMVISQLKT